MIHGVVPLAVVTKILCEEVQVQSFLAGAELRVGVHDLHNGRRRFCEITAVSHAVVKIDGTQPIEDAKADAVIALCTVGDFKRCEGSGVVALCGLPGVGIVRYFCFSPRPLFQTPAAESALGQNFRRDFMIVVHGILLFQNGYVSAVLPEIVPARNLTRRFVPLGTLLIPSHGVASPGDISFSDGHKIFKFHP